MQKKSQPSASTGQDKKVSSSKADNHAHSGDTVGQKEKPLPWMNRTFTNEVPKTKYSLVYEILKRWWYVLPEWPPKNYNYTPVLKQAGLREVPHEAFKFEPEHDSLNLRKVYQMPGYAGVFVDSQNTKYDCRDRKNCPSFTNLKQKGTDELANLLERALDAQIKSLASVPNYDNNLMEELKSFHGKILKSYSKMLGSGTPGNKAN